MNRLKIKFLLGLLVIFVLLIGLFAIYIQQQPSESQTIEHPSREVLIARGYAQAMKDIKAGKPKFYIYGLVTRTGGEKMEKLLKKHNITPVFQGCVIDEGSEYNFSYNKTIKNTFPDSKAMLNKYL
jgi:hypothetical protein